MEQLHEEFSSSQLSSIWDSLSSDACACVAPEILSELWTPNAYVSKCSFEDNIMLLPHEYHELTPAPVTKSFDAAANPDSPCSPLLFNFGPVLQPPPYGPLHLQIQDTPVCDKSLHINSNQSESSEDGEKSISDSTRVKEELDDDSPDSKRRCMGPRVESKKAANKTSTEDTRTAITSAVALGPALNTDGKPRAKRGSATDPQSVYARQRRERINERLRVLQGLVPNGAKVDIVTMLEEAINYVKFLQLQVKLLGSDEYWMYAPTTYNGVNISLGMHLGMQSYLKSKE